MNIWGEAFYDHFCRYLGEPKRRDVFRVRQDAPLIQILSYERVFPGCEVFCSLGFSRFSSNVGAVAEVSLVSDGAFEACSKLLANALFFLVAQNMEIGRGVSVGGIANIDRQFAEKYGKSALYFTTPYVFPAGFAEVTVQGSAIRGKVYWAFFISQDEYEFFKKYGADKFESLLEERKADPFSLQRGQ